MRFLGLLLLLALGTGASRALADDTSTTQAVLYKNPNCSCCEGYAEYLRQSGFSVTIKISDDLTRMSSAAGVPEELEGCHVTMIDGYAVVGHVPVEFVRRLLAEHPQIRGISIPGMPTGLPGMDGPRNGPITVYAISDEEEAVYGTVE
jgi:hypothetical protein